MSNFKKNYETKITDLIKQYEKTNNKLLSCLYREELFDFVEKISENWSKSNTKLGNSYSAMPSNTEILPFENFRDLLRYINVFFFNEIKKKLQNNEKNSKTTEIKLNDLDEAPSKFWKSKVEDYITEVEFSLREILKSTVDDERNFTIKMILSNDFSNLLKNKSNNEFDCFAKFDNLVEKYNIQCVKHDFLNKSNEFNIYESVGFFWEKKKINSNWKKNIILLVITKKENDFRLKIHNKIKFWSIEDPAEREWKGIGTKIDFDTKMTNMSKVKIFAIKS